MSQQAIGKLEARHDYGNYTNITESSLIETGTGTLQGLVINSQTNGTIKFWDNTDEADTVIFDTIYFYSQERYIDFFGAKFTTGLYATITGTVNVTVIWN